MTRPPVRGDDDWADDPAAGEWSAGTDVGWDEGGWDDADWDGADWDGADAGPADPEPAYEYVDEYEELPPEGSRTRRILLVLGLVIGFFALVVGGAFVYLRGQLDPSGPEGRQVAFTIPTGTSATQVATLLEEERIIADAQVFRWYLRYKGQDGFEAGDYVLHENMAAWDVLDVLRAGPAPIDVAEFTMPPGLTMLEYPAQVVDDIPAFDAGEIARLISEQAVRPASLEPGKPLEGFLFPDTYQVRPGDGELAALQRMAEQMDRVIEELQVPARAAALGRTTYEIITIASLIEEEYGVRSEMGKIARVIYNRLERGEPLGIDATSRYEALVERGDRNAIDFTSDSPYNTRRVAGLPPTPIAAPSRAAIEAALTPEPGPWIYYVRDPNAAEPGGHFFTDSAREFERVKAQCAAANLGCG